MWCTIVVPKGKLKVTHVRNFNVASDALNYIWAIGGANIGKLACVANHCLGASTVNPEGVITVLEGELSHGWQSNWSPDTRRVCLGTGGEEA